MIRFEYQYRKDDVKVTLELPSESSLSDLLDAFESFLLASGYVFDGHIDIVEDEEITNE